MRLYPSWHPSHPEYPKEALTLNENELRRRKILTLREAANREMNPREAAKLNALADALAQDQLPLSRPPKKKRQMNLFSPERLD